MELIVCDGGCGSVSPDPETKLYVANHWTILWVSSPNGGSVSHPSKRRYILCDACWELVKMAAPIMKGGERW